MNLPRRLAVKYNIPGVVASGIKSESQRPKFAGSKKCRDCDRTISANKDTCAPCAGIK